MLPPGGCFWESLGPIFGPVGKDHLPHHCQAIFLEEHVFGAAKADTFGAEAGADTRGAEIRAPPLAAIATDGTAATVLTMTPPDPFGYGRIKLDTNGTKPQVLLSLLNKNLIDYIAMDVKAPAERYDEITRSAVDMDGIRRSITLIRNSGIPHEFRMTYAPQLTLEDALETARMVKGCDRFYLQQYRPRNEQDPLAHAPADVLKTGEAIAREIGNCTVRGLGPEQ